MHLQDQFIPPSIPSDPNLTNDLSIRFAQEEDIPEILNLIRELAEYEQLAHCVTATTEILRTSLFGDRRTAEVLLAVAEGKAVGYALFFHNFSTFLGKPGIYIEDIFVRPAFRNNGVGKAFFQKIAALALERDCGRIDWSVLDWNQSAIDFYRAMGAHPVDGWTVYRLVESDFPRIAGLSPCETTPCKDASTNPS